MRGPRARPDDPLEPEDYRRMFGLLEDVAEVSTLGDFRLRLQEAFARRLGWTGVSVLAGFTPEATAASRPGADQFGRRYAEEYRHRWWSVDPFATPHGIHVMRTRGIAVLRDLVTGDLQRAFIDTYLHSYGVTDMLGALIIAGSAGHGFLGVPLLDDRSPGQRERLIVHKLRRQLTTHFENHLAHARQSAAPHGLTPREREVAELVARGYTNDQVARRLHITVDTTKKHFSRVLAKTSCASRTQFVAFWLAQPR